MMDPKHYAEESGIYPIGSGKTEPRFKWWQGRNEFMLHRITQGTCEY